MATTPEKPKLIAIVGPTASGKSKLALRLASLIPSEIISADSRTIYKGMDIGTAKPSILERQKVPHWGLDLREPGQPYSVKEFQDYANGKIEEINNRQKVALLVGGTGLYIDSVLYDFNFVEPASKRQTQLETMTVEQLQALVQEKELLLPPNAKNKRHLIRTIERNGRSGGRGSLRPDTWVVGLWPEDEKLKASISGRAETIFKGGIMAETSALVDKYSREALRLTGGIVYKICVQVLDKEITEQTAATLFKTADWQYARRQKTWFKKNNDIVWFIDNKQAITYLNKLLNT